jgi:hypothetical protein
MEHEMSTTPTNQRGWHYPPIEARVLDDSERNQLAELAHEGCERHCAECGRCDWYPTGPTTEAPVTGQIIADDWYCEDCYPTPGPEIGFNPGPELRVEHDGLALTIQRSHLHPDHAIYYWSITTDGALVPLVDGGLTSDDPTMSLTTIAGHLAWHWYHVDMPEALRLFGWPAIHIYPATTRTPDAGQRATLRVLHQEGLT